MMRSDLTVLALIMVSICFFSAHSFASSSEPISKLTSEGNGGKSDGQPWPCCDNCGSCIRSIPPRCTCNDLVTSCHPECKNCVRAKQLTDPPLYQCMERITNYCKRKCHPK